MKHLIGAGHVAEKFIKDNPQAEVRLYDNNPDLHGTTLQGHKIIPVDALIDVSFGEIVICTTSVAEVQNQLAFLNVDLPIVVPAILEEFQVQSALLDHAPELLIASGLPSNNLHGASGGLFCIKVSADQSLGVTELISGSCHGVVQDGEEYVVSVQSEGLVVLDSAFERKRVIPLPSGARPHGIAVTESHYYVVASNLDSLLKVDKINGDLIQYDFSNKSKYLNSAQHHANDVTIVGNIAYVSMFSVSGAWKHGMFDCGLLEIDLLSGATQPLPLPVKLPHSVCQIENTLVVLNSFESAVFSFGCLPDMRFNGFLRGIDYDDKYLYLAESRNRNSTPLQRSVGPFSIDSKINIVCRETLFSKTVTLPPSISEIHSILLLR